MLKLLRLDSSLIIFLIVFIPLLTRTKDLRLSLGKATPLLFIGFCTFIANGLDDIEKDKINHPERPLPSGRINPSLAAILYFLFLALALLTARHYITTGAAFWYYALLALSTSYGYVVDCFPGIKSLYVAGATTIPVLIVATLFPSEWRLLVIAGSVFFFVLGKELCMDILDRPGDVQSFMHRIDSRRIANSAFFLQALALLLVAIQADGSTDIAGLLAMLVLFLLSVICWTRRADHHRALVLMKAQLLVGLSFLA